MSVVDLFHLFVAAHIATGVVGLVSFWIPVAGRKGGAAHKRVGAVFTFALLATGCFAVGISLCTLISPVATHPHLMSHADFGDAARIRGVFGWMMLYLAVLTVNLAWYGWLVIRNKRAHHRNRTPSNLALQAALLLAAIMCAAQGVLLAWPLLIGMSTIGFATVATNLWFLYRTDPGPKDWLIEHFKALVGAGISVYTAFFAFGAVRLLPEAALTPALWSAPLTVGLAIIFYHRWRVLRPAGRRDRAASAI